MGARADETNAPARTVLLSELVGSRVQTPDGERGGAVKDLTVRLGEPHPVVRRLLVRSGSTCSLVSWDAVEAMPPHPVTVTPEALVEVGAGSSEVPLRPDELLLARDVLDTQVVDVEGRRLSRVSDVLLLARDDGRLEVLAADVGVAALLRRTGLGWLAGHRGPVAVDWQDLHLTSGRGHLVQLSTGSAAFRRLDARGLAELVTRLSTGNATDVLRRVEPERAAAAIHEAHPHTARRLLHALGTADARRLVEAASAHETRRLEQLARRRSLARRRRFRRTAGWRLHRPDGSRRRPSDSTNAEP